jgi:hypothetical protein
MYEDEDDPPVIDAAYETRVFVNNGGNITILQKTPNEECDEQLVVFPASAAKKLMAAIRAAVRDIEEQEVLRFMKVKPHA